MKKIRKRIGAAILAICIVVAVMNANLTRDTANNDLTLRNVEALAQGEGGDWECWGSGSILCPNGGKYYAVVTR